MKKIGFVTPWYGDNIPGGAEMELRGLVKHLQAAGQEVEVLTTCVKEFLADWNKNYHQPGLTTEGGIPVRRFKVRRRNVQDFDIVNLKLMRNQAITREEEQIYVREMINSPALIDYIRAHEEEYHAFVCIPYMFGPVYHTAVACPQKTILIPCFHDESYVYMNVFKQAYSKVRGIVYNALPEMELANRIYNLTNVKQTVVGVGVDTSLTCDEARFREKFGIRQPFILYAGRKDVGKNIYTLIRYYEQYKKRRQGDLKLVLIGGGTVKIPPEIAADVIDLGFVDIQDKYDAYAAAAMLCQPSKHESFSLVVMESWLCQRPVLIHAQCEVTAHFARSSNAGLYFTNYFEFEGCVDYLLQHPQTAAAMGKLGRRFVLDNFAYTVIVEKYLRFLSEAISNEPQA